uniref:RRM domain-containing protein n=1 Tax=Kalanchoe fedtschenkoi TaxID=63787 RepID=A0A7N0UJT1_KALFE
MRKFRSAIRTTADDLFPLFERYGRVVDVLIPRDRRTGDSRGFAFVRYKYADEAQKAVERLDGRTVDGREIMVQFAKYGPNAERIQKGRIIESTYKEKSRSRSPRPRYREHYRDKDYRRSRSKSPDRYPCDKYRERERESRRRSRRASPYHSRDRRRGRYEDERRSRSRSYESSSPMRSPLPLKASPRDVSPDGRKRSPTPSSVSPHRRPAAS